MSATPADSALTRRVAVVGMFDGVHTGHRYLLGELRREAGALGAAPLVVTFANHPLSVIAPGKEPGLLTTPDEKLRLLRQLGFGPGEVLMLDFDPALRATSAADFLAMLHDRHGADWLLMGFNNRFGHDAPRDFDAYRALAAGSGVTLRVASEYGTAVSSTTIRRLVADGDIAAANDMLGHPFRLTGTVTRGKALGRRIGFPTANLAVPAAYLLPATGVYAATAIIDSPTEQGAPATDHAASVTGHVVPRAGYPCMVNIGCRPTVDADGAPLSIEAHLIGLPEGTDLYDSRVTLAFAARLRDECRFPTLEALTAQLAADRAAALAALA